MRAIATIRFEGITNAPSTPQVTAPKVRTIFAGPIYNDRLVWIGQRHRLRRVPDLEQRLLRQVTDDETGVEIELLANGDPAIWEHDDTPTVSRTDRSLPKGKGPLFLVTVPIRVGRRPAKGHRLVRILGPNLAKSAIEFVELFGQRK
jgi:hypothetical protein